MFKKILVATDGSECSRKATEQAIRLARECGASLVAVAASDIYPAYIIPVAGFASLQQLIDENGGTILSDVEKLAAAAEVKCPASRSGLPTSLRTVRSFRSRKRKVAI